MKRDKTAYWIQIIGWTIVIILSLIYFASIPAHGSSLSTHLSTSIIISSWCDTPQESFLQNMLAHIALDYYDFEYWMDTPAGNYDYIGFEILLSGIQIRRIIKENDLDRRKILLWGAAGAVAFDALEIPGKLSGRDPIFNWHYNHYNGEICSKSESMLRSGAVFALSWRF